MRQAAPALTMTTLQRETLDKVARSRTAPHREVVRARALLAAAEGAANTRIAAELGVTAVSVREWRKRFEAEGLTQWGKVRQGRGRKTTIDETKIAEIVDLTLHYTPEGHTHWSCRTMAEHVGVSPATVQRIWDARGLKPHRVETFKLSNDPQFEDKLIDVVGLYLAPPEKAIVLCMDEKSQIQALDRTQPSLPMVKGRGETMTHDYKRNGTTDLFAALNSASGEVLHDFRESHAGADVLAFFKPIDKTVPRALAVQVVLDNLSAHKAPEVQPGSPSPASAAGSCTSYRPRAPG